MKDTFTLAEKIYNMTLDMDFMDYAETKCSEIADLVKALSQMKAYATTKPEFQTLLNALDLITGEDD